MSIRSLEPQIIWNHFEDLNAIPRPSKKEERVIQFMLDFGANLRLETLKDEIGNVIIKKPASPGFENRETIILQSHLDMVHQKNSDTDFDFDSEGIRSYIDGEWVTAEGTTLGADNGMGAAAAMSILSSTTIQHPTIEALFTIDEETGMTGAKELDGSLLSGKILLNLDTEDDDEFSVGCAGGRDTNTLFQYEEVLIPASFKRMQLEIKGLKGGHSGMDIHLGRGNANLWMNRILLNLNKAVDFRIIELEGGSLRNAIPRESVGVFGFDATKEEQVREAFETIKKDILDEYSIGESKAMITLSDCDSKHDKMMSKPDQIKAIATVYITPNGVWKMSEKMEGIVETSSSLAKVIFRKGEFITKSLQRSMIESGKEDIANAIRVNYERMGATVTQSGDYPGWAPNPNSPILKVLEDKYTKLFNETPKVAACHAGLECGILSKHLPGCDMISFGPTIKNPHSPDEKVNIKSVQKFWDFLLEVLAATPIKN
ncbi:aminoacyl-histidine dipeptidase [Crocinitomix sp.]|nr:aminoacyl-histidine dipeptidase [Crocinitomix sp.]